MRKNLEAQHQQAFFEWLAYTYPMIYKLTFAIPNGGLRDKGTAIQLKLTGTKAGVADIMMAVPTDYYNGLFIEMKSEKGRLTEKQKEFIELVRRQGYAAEVCFSVDEAILIVKQYLGEET